MVTYGEFCAACSKKLTANSDANAVFDFLCIPENIHNMIVMSNLGLPAISGIVKELEANFSNSASFPLTDENRRHIGNMVKLIIRQFGYEPVFRRVQLRNFTGAKIFKTSSIYAKTKKPQSVLTIQIQ